MILVEPQIIIMSPVGPRLMVHIERAGRTCYKSERIFTKETGCKFCKMLIERGHESVLEHSSVTVKFICDRGVSHEFVRHRIASFSQESTRYCNYSKEKFGGELTFINPYFFSRSSPETAYNLLARNEFVSSIAEAEKRYLSLIDLGAQPEEARAVLPNSLKTELVMTCNMREWRHFFQLRTPETAHPQARQLAIPLLVEFKNKMGELFLDIPIPEFKLPLASLTYDLLE